MPIYEYICGNCRKKFSQLRPMSKADSPISLFSAISRGGNGESHAVKGSGGGCGSCAGGHCGSCSH